MIRSATALLAAGLTALALLVTACSDDSENSDAPPAQSATATAAAGTDGKLDKVKANSFAISFRGAFPQLAGNRDNAALGAVFTESCADIRAGKSEADVTPAISERLTDGNSRATPEEAKAVYQMIAAMCN